MFFCFLFCNSVHFRRSIDWPWFVSWRSILDTPFYVFILRLNDNRKSEKMLFWLFQIQAVPPCTSPQSWPHPSLLTGKQRTGPRGEPAFMRLYTLPLCSPGGRPRTSGPSVWSTYQEQRLNSSPGIIKQVNEQGGHTKVTESEWAKRDRQGGG